MAEIIIEKKRFIHSLVFPTFFLFVIWAIKLIEYFFDLDFSQYGVFPHKLKGIPGIFLSPLIHGDFNHLIANTTPLFTLGVGIFYFYNKISYKIFILIYLITGLWVWFGAREAYHIGASGLVYGYASFLFFGGIIRNDLRLLALSLLVVFLYGSMVWGILPLDEKVSWESHLLGSVAGLVLAIIYRKEGPEKIKYSWETEEFETEEGYTDTSCTIKESDVSYHYNQDIEKKSDKE
ncbi:MAG: rhomboid family intramembrane serine protease [Bacteroidota bacterium]